MVSHVNSVVKKVSFHLRKSGKVRKLLTEDAKKKAMQNLLISRINYCNALLSGIQQDIIAKLQRLQNHAARIVTRIKWHEHITPVLEHQHWLPVKFRIDFKILLIVFKPLNGLVPEYVSELLAIYKPTRTLRSGSQGFLVEPKTRLAKMGDRAFSNYALRLSGISWHRTSKLIHQFRLLKRTSNPSVLVGFSLETLNSFRKDMYFLTFFATSCFFML